MANTRELRRRIKSIKNTAQITKAMQMVAATKMRRAQIQAVSARPYSLTLSEVLQQATENNITLTHPLLLPNNSSKTGVLLFTSDKGLCGALNTNVFRTIQTDDNLQKKDLIYYTVGKKGRDFVVRTGKSLEADFENFEHVEYGQAVKLRKFLVSEFLENKVSEVYILYPDFKSALRQEPKLVKLLPIDLSMAGPATTGGSEKGSRRMTAASGTSEDVRRDLELTGPVGEILFEPSINEVLYFALIHHLDTQIYQGLLETKASEHSARMMAMQNATNNAKDLVDDLSLAYNQARQDNITKELLEITSAAAALE